MLMVVDDDGCASASIVWFSKGKKDIPYVGKNMLKVTFLYHFILFYFRDRLL